MSRLPKDLVQHVARELIERCTSIKHEPKLIREISPHPLPSSHFKSAGLTAPLSQWRVSDEAPNPSWLAKLNPFAPSVQTLGFASLCQPMDQPAASLVFAPLVLDEATDVLEAFAHLPQWFSNDGVLLFATLGAGGLPELVNAQPEWLDLLAHWPNIMDAGARLQALRFDLPVLDVETMHLSYGDFDAMWLDVCAFIPALTTNDATWKSRLLDLYQKGLRQLSVQVLYGQVWQVRAPRQAGDTHTVSLESLTAQLHHRKTFGGSV